MKFVSKNPFLHKKKQKQNKTEQRNKQTNKQTKTPHTKTCKSNTFSAFRQLIWSEF